MRTFSNLLAGIAPLNIIELPDILIEKSENKFSHTFRKIEEAVKMSI